MLNRRGFLRTLAGAIAAAGAGITLAPKASAAEQITEQTKLALPKRVLNARHLYWYDKNHDAWAHRIDVRFDDQQWGVDMITQTKELDAKRELEPALACLENGLEKYDVVVGEIFTFSVDEWHGDVAAQARWISNG